MFKSKDCPYASFHTEENRGKRDSSKQRNRELQSSKRGRSAERNNTSKPNQPTRGRSPSGVENAKLCSFFKAGKCKEGDKCKFGHPGVCKFFKQGKCSLGNKCIFQHTPNTAAVASDDEATPNPKAKVKPKTKNKNKNDNETEGGNGCIAGANACFILHPEAHVSRF